MVVRGFLVACIIWVTGFMISLFGHVFIAM